MKRIICTMLCVLCMAGAGMTGCGSNVKPAADNNPAQEIKQEDTQKLTDAAAPENIKEDAKEPAADKSGSYNVEEKDVTLYLGSADEKQDYKLYFFNGGVIPYIPAEDIGMFLEQAFYGSGSSGFYELKYSTDGDHAVYARDGGAYTMDFDFSGDTITFADYDEFYRQKGAGLIDMVWLMPSIEKLYRKSEMSTDRYGKTLLIDLKPYEIDLVKSGDGYYVPLQTVSDLIMGYYDVCALYNGKDVIITPGMDEKLTEIYQSGNMEWSEEFAAYNYNSLCCALDYIYGLKDIHGINTFDELFTETGLKYEFLNRDAASADAALYKLIYYFIGDVHSQFNVPSFMTDMEKLKDSVASGQGQGLANAKVFGTKAELSAAREAYYPDGIPAYEEVGNTAYITFDAFIDPSDSIDYYAPPTEADNSMADTIRLMQYALSQILRDQSPIKNVVLDLSVNGGGSTTAAEYVMASFLGEADFSTKNMMTGAMTDAVYTVDTNLDGKFDEKDTLDNKGLNLFCLASPGSFSCGNLTPCVFKASQKVTLLGKTSGGGSCSVHSMSTASGTMFMISGFRRFSVMKNGSFYDIDTGAEPHYFIEDADRYYDRKSLTNYINNL